MHKKAKKILSRCPTLSQKIAPKKSCLLFNKIFFFIGPSLPLNEFRAGMDMVEKDGGCKKKLKLSKKKSCFVPHAVFSNSGWQQD